MKLKVPSYKTSVGTANEVQSDLRIIENEFNSLAKEVSNNKATINAVNILLKDVRRDFNDRITYLESRLESQEDTNNELRVSIAVLKSEQSKLVSLLQVFKKRLDEHLDKPVPPVVPKKEPWYKRVLGKIKKFFKNLFKK